MITLRYNRALLTYHFLLLTFWRIMKKRFTPLVFIFTAIITVMCQCQMTNRDVKLAGHDCKYTGSYDTDTSRYDGTFDCKNPDGSMLTCPYTGAAVTNSKVFLRDQTSVMTDAQFWAYLGCVSPSQATPTSTPTPVPTSTATAAPAAAESNQGVAAPLVTGDVSACNVNDGFINFKLVEGVPPFNSNEVVVVMNGTQVNCTVPSNNTSVLSCGLPAGVTFPLQVSVARGDSVANQFSYNGDACLYVAPPKDAPDDDPLSTDVAPTACTGDCP